MSDLLAALQRQYPGAISFQFGDSAALSAELIALVRAGLKVATCGSQAQYEAGEVPPMLGRKDIALNWDGTPAFVIETVEIIRCRFDEVTEAMALAEGEDDSLEGWRIGHQQYFARNGGFSPDMAVLWERFRLIEDLADKT